MLPSFPAGLNKAQDALKLLQELIGEAVYKAAQREHLEGCSEPPPPLSAEVFKVVAALQVYGGWTKKQSDLLQKCEELQRKWGGAPGEFHRQLRQHMHVGEGMLAMYDQCSSVALMLNRIEGVQESSTLQGSPLSTAPMCCPYVLPLCAAPLCCPSVLPLCAVPLCCLGSCRRLTCWSPWALSCCA